MKPFAIRLAAGAVTILLGAVMAAQAQKDHQDEVISAWNPTMDLQETTPAPIAADGIASDGNKDPSPFPDVPDAIQLVQHTEPAPSNTFAIPDTLPLEEATNANPMPALNLPPAMTGAIADIKDKALQAVQMPDMKMPQVDLPDVRMPDVRMPESMVSDLRGVASDLRGAAANVATTAGEMLADTSPSNGLRSNAGQPMRQPMSQPINADPVQMIRNVTPSEAVSTAPVHSADVHGVPANNIRMNDAPMNLRDDRRMPESLAMQNDPMQYADERLPANAPAYQPEQLRRTEQLREPAPQLNSNFVDQRSNQGPSAPALRNDFARNPRAAGNPVARNGFPGRMASAPIDNRAPSLDQTRNLPTGATGLGQPGDRRLEGAQSPSVVIHKRAPREVKVGKPASFVIQVQNVGSAEALNVQVMDMIPAGMSFSEATPQPAGTTAKGEYVWQLGNLAAGEERTVTMELIPQSEGELGSVARVTFEAAASVRTISTRPELKIVQKAPKTVRIGQQLEIEVEVSNPGTGDATGVILQEDVPDGLEHPQGRQLDNLIGTLRPGEVRRQMLRLRAVAPGVVRNAIRLKADDGLVANHAVNVEVVAPDLQVVLNGPARRYLERQARFELAVVNAGTADATNVDITAFLDRGFRFVSTGNQGQYDQGRHAVVWKLDQLRPNSKGTIPLTLLPVQEGTRAIQLEAKADLGAIAKNEHSVAVDALAELAFSINDTADPIEVGTETTYEIKVTNSGSRPDTNVQVQLTFPPGIKVQSADGDARELENQPGVILFSPRARLDANGEMVYRVKAMGNQQGTHLIKAVVVSDQSPVQVTKEESTMVYNDQGTVAARPVGFRR